MPQVGPTASGSTSVVQLVRRSVGSLLPELELQHLSGATPSAIWQSSAPCCGGAHRKSWPNDSRQSDSSVLSLTGFRHTRHNPHVGATLIRPFGFFLFASTYWALLPF